MEIQPVTVYLSLGSNLGDREENLRRALSAFKAEGIDTRKISSCYETEPVGFRDQPWFLNIAVEAATCLLPRQLLARCLGIERRLGRVRTFAGAPRTLDIDILLYEDRVIQEEDLVIPHPRMQRRRFVLEPMAEIAPGVLHPVFEKTVHALLAACSDPSTVRIHPTGGLLLCRPI